jgi:molybdopterin-guanine dinucleotide biosynthesis protein A
MGNSLIVFAGGRATRLSGLNKALLTVGDRTIVQRILDELGPLTDERLILTNDDTLSGLSRQETCA